MSASVWFEEVNVALISEIHSSVKVRDSKGVLIPLSYDQNTPEKNAIFVRKPEEDFKSERFPCVSIYNKTYSHEPIRYSPVPVKVGYSDDMRMVELKDSPVPFNLYYQIDFWARYQTDMDSMTKTWLMNHFRQFNLDVSEGDIPMSCNCLFDGKVIKSDLVLNNERLFHSIVNLEIWVELDNDASYNKHVVITRDISLKGDSE